MKQSNQTHEIGTLSIKVMNFTCLASFKQFLGTGDSGLSKLEDRCFGPEEMGLEKDEEFVVGLVRGGERERGERRVSM